MLRLGATARRDLWFATGGIGVGLSTTLLGGGLGLGEREQSWMTFALVALLAVFPTFFAADERLSPRRSCLRTGVLCFLLSIPTLVLLMAVSSDRRATPGVCAIWFFAAVVLAWLACLAYAPALIACNLLARSAADRPAGSIGAGRWLLVLVAGIAAVGSWWTVTARHDGGYAMWRELAALDLFLAALCAGVALRDGAWAVRLYAIARNRDGVLRTATDVDPPPSAPHLVTPTVRRQGPLVVVVRICPVPDGVYRTTEAASPILVLDGTPARVVASLRRSALLAVGLALCLAGAAAGAPWIAHARPRSPPMFLTEVPGLESAERTEERQDRLDTYAPWWLSEALDHRSR